MSDEVTSVTPLWLADPDNPVSVWAVCSPADAYYTLYWGDGTSTPMAPTSAPIRHTYPRAGQYTLAAITTSVATTDVVVRGQRADTTFTLDGDGRTVHAELPQVEEPLQYQVDWGDGAVTQHGADDLSPAHTYQPGFGVAMIAVTDVPARWTVRYTGPTISGFPQAVFRPDTENLGYGQIDLTGFPPGVTVSAEYLSDNLKQFAEPVDTEDDGTATFYFKLWSWPFSDWWRWARFTWTDPDTSEQMQLTQHMRVCEWDNTRYGRCACVENAIPITLDWDTDRPYVITATATPVPAGDYTIEWGDGHTTQHTVGDLQRMDVTHDYGSNQAVWISISGPPGTGRRFVRPHTIDHIESTSYGPVLWWAAETGDADSLDPYRPVRIDPGDGRWPHIDTVSCSVDPRNRCGTGWNYADVGQYVSRISAPMTDSYEFPYTQESDGGFGGTDYNILPDAPELSWTFSVGTATENYYTGTFTLAKSTAYPADWQMEFSLGPGEVLADAGPHTVSDLGNQRWRITSTVQVPGFDKLQFDIRVDPATDPRVLPLDVRTVPPSLPLL